MSPIEAMHQDPSGNAATQNQQFDLDPTKVTRQRMLSATEIVKLIDADWERLKQEFGELHSGAAYGRITWRIRLEFGLAVPGNLRPFIETKSRRIAHNLVSQNEALAAVEDHPLKGADGVASVELERRVTSPNLERIRNEIPIPTTVSQRDGTHSIQPVTYPKPAPGEPGYGDGDMTVTDHSLEAATSIGAAWDLSEEEAAMLDAQNGVEADANAAAEQAAASTMPVEDATREERTNELLDSPQS